MLPIAPLMIEHRLIERMIRLLDQEQTRIRENIGVLPEFAFVNAKFIDAAVDFMKTYADQVHHGKEEDILFTALLEKPLAQEHRQMMQELQADHKWGRQTTAKLLAAKDEYFSGQKAALDQLLENLAALGGILPPAYRERGQEFFSPGYGVFYSGGKGCPAGENE